MINILYRAIFVVIFGEWFQLLFRQSREYDSDYLFLKSIDVKLLLVFRFLISFYQKDDIEYERRCRSGETAETYRIAISDRRWYTRRFS